VHDVTAVAMGRAALAAIREDAPDLLLLDLKLPDIDSLQDLRQARDLAPLLRTLIITAYADVA
jgi:CheY-like chemotaxis protein